MIASNSEQFLKFLDYVEAMLNHGVDPNVSSSKTWRPVLLAALQARPAVLEVLKRFSGSGKTGSKPVRFDVWTEDSAETVLHLVLKKSVVRQLAGGIGTEKELKDAESKYDS